MPSSGRVLARGSSHLGPPTAPNRMASVLAHISWVSSGKGVPKSSMALPPTLPYEMSKSWPKRVSTACITLTASDITSGPMPSPGKTAMEKFIIRSQMVWYSLRYRAKGIIIQNRNRMRGDSAFCEKVAKRLLGGLGQGGIMGLMHVR